MLLISLVARGGGKTWDVLSLFFTSVVVWGHLNNPTSCSPWRHKYIFTSTDQLFPLHWFCLEREAVCISHGLVTGFEASTTGHSFKSSDMFCHAFPVVNTTIIISLVIFIVSFFFSYTYIFSDNFFWGRYHILAVYTKWFISSLHISSFIISKHRHILLWIIIKGSHQCRLKQASVNVNVNCS